MTICGCDEAQATVMRDAAGQDDGGLQREGATVVIDGVPARVCENCGEGYVDQKVAESVLASAAASARTGVGSRSATNVAA